MSTTLGSGQAVQVLSHTWARDSHDLFDFEAHAQHLRTQKFGAQGSATCFRNGAEVQLLSGEGLLHPSPGSEALFRLVQRDRGFWVDKASPFTGAKKLWLVVRELPAKVHQLSEGDVIKLGRFKFRVRQLVASEQEGVKPELRLDEKGGSCCPDSTVTDQSSGVCRICLTEGPGQDDPLITPCKCKGSIEYVHLGCLRHWVRGRLNLADSPNGSYFYRPLACELCKAVYPTYVRSGADREPLVEVPPTQPPFIVLENMVRDSQQHASRGLHVISLADGKALKLGRGHESDVRIADVSISRCHTVIRCQAGQFLLEDNNSKFGTLVAMKKPRRLEPGMALSIQMGRSLIALSLTSDARDSNGGVTCDPPSFLPPSGGSNAQDERALRLSLLHREDSSAVGGGGGPPASRDSPA